MELQKRICSLKDDSGLDRLSEMPDQVIVHILSYMPTHEAVRTMLLRRFGKLWTSVSALRFDFSEYYVRRDSSSDDDEDDDDDKEQASIDAAFVHFTRFVRNVLMLHKRPTIDSFHLNLIFSQRINVDQYISKDARVWLQFATDREVKHLFFGSKRWDSLSPHCCVFTSQSLVTLVLHGCMLEEHSLQSQPHHMGSLRKLRLVDVKGTDEAFDQLISACPSLQELDIYLPFGFWTITSPTVRRLNLEMRVYRRLKLNCPLLQALRIGIFGDSPSFVLSALDVSSLEVVNVARLLEGLSHIKAFLKEFRDVKLFSLSSQAFEQLCHSEKMDFPQNTWQCLALHPQWNHERCLEVIIELLKSSVKLDVLLIESGQSSGELEVLSSELSSSASCVIPLLRHVSIHVCSKYYEVQLQVVEFILKSAVDLEALLITSEDEQLTVFEMLEFLKEVSRFKRASVNAFVDTYRKS